MSAHAVAPVTATAHRPDALRPPVASAPLGLRALVRTAAVPAAAARREQPPALEIRPRGGPVAPAAPTAHRAATPTPPTRARAAPAPGTGAHRTRALAPPGVRRARPAALLTQRRARAPWHLLPRERLAAAWAGVQGAHRAAQADLHLVGVYGPVPLGAVEAVRLEPDGRLRVTLGRRRAEPLGDIALARHLPSQRLVRCDVPYPPRGRSGRTLR